MREPLPAAQHRAAQPGAETAEAHRLRLAREAAMLAEAEAQLASGEAVPLEALEAWLDRLEQDEAAPLPRPPGR
jgi:hypothetical protein